MEKRSFLKVLSWNINGIRTAKSIKETLDSLDADVICLQETKVTRDMIDEPTALVDGYNSYFSFSRARSGYSGVATYCKEIATPERAEEGLSGLLNTSPQCDTVGCYEELENEFTPQELKRLDNEGRAVITQHKVQDENGRERLLTIFNVYCPRADPERPDRLEYKLRFYELLRVRATALKRSGSHVIILGDINTSHRQIDRCENVPQDEFDGNPARQWLNSFISNPWSEDYSSTKADEFFRVVDSFRYFHPNQTDAYTCWNTMLNARATNYGSRIDYIFVDEALIQNMTDSFILSEVQGSDHCPIAGSFSLQWKSSLKCPSTCIKFFPEFSGKQQKLSSYFSKRSENDDNENLTKKARITTTETKVNGLKSVKKSNQVGIMKFFQKTKVSEECTASMSSSQESNSASSESEMNFFEIPAIQKEKSSATANAWKKLLSGPQPPPLCQGHSEPCVERRVKKTGPNFNRKFFACARGEGSKSDPRARCNHFEWALKR